ncbi:hypothetical protein [Streptomyces sp. NPDC001292]|uniref:hypothetical protein n=1 Tax=Streptomyces sp. NPDC001292 TaxID=3364558 RepID=UPI0036BE40AB
MPAPSPITASRRQDAAKLQDGIRERTAARDPRPQPATAAPPDTPSSPAAIPRRVRGHPPREEPHDHAAQRLEDRGRRRPCEGGRAERAAAYGPPPWQPIWKRPKELREQRKRLREAGKRHFAVGQSLRPRSRRNRIGSAAARRDARALSRMRHSNAWLR